MAYAHSRKPQRSDGHIVVQTFGNFEIFVDGETLVFHRQKAKELLAYLIDRGGRGVNRPGIFAALWEEGQYDYSRQKYLDVIIRSLRETLKEAGVEQILEIKGGFLRVKTEMLDCDLYRFLRNDPEAVNAYRGNTWRNTLGRYSMLRPCPPESKHDSADFPSEYETACNARLFFCAS